MFVRRATALAAALLVLTAAFTARAETLMEALATAYTTNPTLAAQRAQQRQNDEQVPQALSGWRPQVSVIGRAGKARQDTEFTGPETTTPRQYGLDVTQPLFRGGQTVAATRAAENTVRAGRARLVSVEQDVLLNAVEAYVNVLAAQAVLEFEVQNEQRLTRFLEATSDRFEVGEVTRTDVFQAEARLARASADRVQAEGNLEAARADYIAVVGAPPTNLTLPEVPADLPESMTAAAELATERNPQVVAAEFDERATADTVDQIRGELLPELNLRGEAIRAHDGGGVVGGGRVDDFRATVNVEVPLYQGGAVYSRVRQAKQAVFEQRRIVDDQRREAAQLATTAWSNYLAARASVEAFTTEVRANEVAVDGVLREQAVGTRTVLDVLDTQQDLLQSQRSLVDARRNELRFAYEVKRAIGTLTAELLGLPVDYYNPEVYYRDVRNQWFGTGDIEAGSMPTERRP